MININLETESRPIWSGPNFLIASWGRIWLLHLSGIWFHSPFFIPPFYHSLKILLSLLLAKITGQKSFWKLLPLPLITRGVVGKWCKACPSLGTEHSKLLLIAWGTREPEGILNQTLSLAHQCTICCNNLLSLGTLSSIKGGVVKYSTFRALNLLFFTGRNCNAISESMASSGTIYCLLLCHDISP